MVLGWLGMQPATPELSEVGLRLSELYFAFFLLLWVFSKERSGRFMGITFAVVAGLLLVIDAVRYDEAKGGLMLTSMIIPAVYLVFFFFAPVFSNLNQSRSVPERVTA